MRNKIGTIFIIFLLTVLLGVSVSFAWMLQDQPEAVREIDVTYGNGSGNDLVVAPQDIEMALYVAGENGEMQEAPNEGFALSGIIPGAARVFRIRIKNNAGKTVSIKLSLASITAEIFGDKNEENTGTLLDYTFISIRGGTGYFDSPVASPALYKRLNEGYTYSEVSQKFAVPLIDNLQVPATSDSSYVELNCYFLLDPEAGLDCQNRSLKIGSFRAEK